MPAPHISFICVAMFGLGAIAGLEGFQNSGHMDLNGAGGDIHFPGDYLVGFAFGDAFEHLKLPSGKAGGNQWSVLVY